MKCVIVLVAIILIGVQEHEAAPEESLERSLFSQVPSVDLIRKALLDSFENYENECQIALKRTENTYLKSLHDWLSNENYHYQASLRRIIDASHGENQECQKGTDEIRKLFESSYKKAANCIHGYHITYSRKTVYDKLARDMPQGFNVIQWIWYLVKFPINGLTAYQAAVTSVNEMENDMRKCNSEALSKIRAKIDENLTKCTEEVIATTVPPTTRTPVVVDSPTLLPLFFDAVTTIKTTY